MTEKRIAFLFIGQTPRPDTMVEMKAYLPGYIIQEYGALDGLESHTIFEEYQPLNEADLLITRLRNGRSVQVSERGLIHRLQYKLDQSVEEGARLCVLMCTGSFTTLRCEIPMLTMDEVFHQQLDFSPEVACIGLIVPLEGQREFFTAQYGHLQRAIVSAAASPYEDPLKICNAARTLKNQGADCICLDCMGYTSAQAEQVAADTGLEVYTPRREMAKRILQYDKQL